MLWTVIILGIICVLARCFFAWRDVEYRAVETDGMCQITGNREVQADAMGITATAAGKLAVLADGIGKENTGKVCAALAVEGFEEAFAVYRVLNNPQYFFERTMYSLHKKTQKLLEERTGGAGVGAVFFTDTKLWYASTGQVKVLLVRNGELIPLSEGQTVAVLAQRAWREGKLGRQETLWALSNGEAVNYVGKDGFLGAELCDVPITLKKGDLAVLMTKGIYEEVPGAQLEKVLAAGGLTAQEKAERIAGLAAKAPGQDKENGSIMVLPTDGATG